MWNGEQYAIKEGQCIIKIPEMAAFLNCSVYALRQEPERLGGKESDHQEEIHLRTCRGDHQLYKLIYRST